MESKDHLKALLAILTKQLFEYLDNEVVEQQERFNIYGLALANLVAQFLVVPDKDNFEKNLQFFINTVKGAAVLASQALDDFWETYNDKH